MHWLFPLKMIVGFGIGMTQPTFLQPFARDPFVRHCTGLSLGAPLVSEPRIPHAVSLGGGVTINSQKRKHGRIIGNKRRALRKRTGQDSARCPID